MADRTQKPPLDTAESYLADALKMAEKGDVHSASLLFDAAASAALVSLARTMDILDGKLWACGHGHIGAFCHLCTGSR